MFNSSLDNVPKYTDSENKQERELPKFLVKIIKMIESKIETVGLYRVNGDASEVQQIRYSQFRGLELNKRISCGMYYFQSDIISYVLLWSFLDMQ